MFKNRKLWKIKPEGWLKKQLEIQANGLSGNLNKIWPDISQSAWIGGNREGWERVPYWLDGFIPLAYLLEDEALIATAEKYVSAILDKQQEDGWICPCKEDEKQEYDLWALLLISKVLTVYCEFTANERARTALYKAMKNFYEMLTAGKATIGYWGEFRWYEGFISLIYLYEVYEEEWMIDLAKYLKNNGINYCTLTDKWDKPKNEWKLETHIVNICMMLKYEALISYFLGDEYTDKAECLWQLLEEKHGTAVGGFTGDECLSGIENNRGTELCSIVELMYSCEVLFELTGNPIWADRLEKLAFNALPATISEDMWSHQYDQQVNQIGCVIGEKSFFRTNNNEAHLFGLEPNFGCCTANFNQGWPKLALNSFLPTKNGILCPVMLPSSLETTIKGTKVTVKSETEYPFRLKGKLTVTAESPVNFELKIKIPGWTKSLKINGENIVKDNFYTVKKDWVGKSSIEIEFFDTPHLVDRPFGLKCVEYGSLVFSLPIKTEYVMHEYASDGVVRKYPYCDYELFPKSEWRYGFCDSDFEVFEYESDIPFSVSKPKVTVKARLAGVNWDMVEGFNYIAKEKPNSSDPTSPPEVKELCPYGAAKLRITEMTVIK